eukprot:TRINITY_DN5748_c0_g1_i1.p1 TRINITY_DN5748_c0_g1~~TRINITY_DN5748_c0_g1_i1.p1  ORF type:complete len:756 (-),score=196.51 TRINITY_DN5748_c0_g1_i1:23-2290(-)
MERELLDPEEFYEIYDRIGFGSHGEVYRAISKETKCMVAVKIVPIDGENDEETKQMLTEITIMKKLKSPYVTEYFGSYIKGGNLWISMELFEGGSAHNVMKALGKGFNEEQIRSIVYQVIRALVTMHDAKMIHRDLKADNILLNRKGHAKLGDFGVSRKMMTNAGKKMTATGSPYWIAPEVMTSENYNSEIDVWSLGITAIELAERQPPYYSYLPFRAMFLIGDSKKPPPHLTAPEAWSSDFNNFIRACLIKDPTKRPSSHRMLKHDFIESDPGTQCVAETVEEFIVKDELRRREDETSLHQHKRDSSTSSEDEPVLSGNASHQSNSLPLSFGRRKMSQAVAALKNHVSDENMEIRTRPRSPSSGSPILRPTLAESTSKDEEVWRMSELISLMRDPEKGIALKDKVYRFKKKSCFTTSAAIHWMLSIPQLNLGNERDNAISIGQELHERGIIESLNKGGSFSDKKSYFYFVDIAEGNTVLNVTKIWDSTNPSRDPCDLILDLLFQIGGLYERHWESRDPIDPNPLSSVGTDPAYFSFQEAVSELQQVDLNRLEPAERKVFWLNLHNTLLLHAYVESKFPGNFAQKVLMHSKMKYQVGNLKLSLADIEYGILRNSMTRANLSFEKHAAVKPKKGETYFQVEPDYRINFGIFAMTKSGPPFRYFTADNVDRELDLAMVDYLDKSVDINHQSKKKVVNVPKMFDWYMKDFVKSEKEFLGWLTSSLDRLPMDPTSVLYTIDATLPIKFRDYQWEFMFYR